MIKFATIAAAGAFAFAMGASTTVMAQAAGAIGSDRPEMTEGRGRGDRDNRGQRGARRSTGPTPAQVMASSQTVLTGMNRDCTVTEATLLGSTPEGVKYYEAVCAQGLGYLLSDGEAPTSTDCLQLDSQAKIARERDPNADVGTLCTLPANQNLLPVVKAYALQAGVPCDVNEGMATGQNTAAGSIFYEVGCDGTGGYRLEQTAGNWSKVSCLQMVSSGLTCRFTSNEELFADMKGVLAGTEGAGCTPTAVRIMGTNSNGQFLETTCTESSGFIARVKDGATQDVYSCDNAAHIGGGCTLAARAAAAPASQD